MPSPNPPVKGESNTAALLTFLHQSGQILALKANEVLFREGSPCEGAYFLEQGSIELTIESGGHRVHVGSAHPGQLLGLTSVLTGSPSQNTATAMLPTKLVFVKAQLILEYLKTHPEICLNAVQSLASDIVDLSANTIRSMRFYNRKPHP